MKRRIVSSSMRVSALHQRSQAVLPGLIQEGSAMRDGAFSASTMLDSIIFPAVPASSTTRHGLEGGAALFTSPSPSSLGERSTSRDSPFRLRYIPAQSVRSDSVIAA